MCLRDWMKRLRNFESTYGPLHFFGLAFYDSYLFCYNPSIKYLDTDNIKKKIIL